jgi:hypothetical protein
MDQEAIVKLILKKGIRNTNLGMFTEAERREILEKCAEQYFRLGNTEEVLNILQVTNLEKYANMMKKIAEDFIGIGEYRKAADIYEKIGQKEFAASIRENI